MLTITPKTVYASLLLVPLLGGCDCTGTETADTSVQAIESTQQKGLDGTWDIRWEGISFVFAKAVPMFGYLSITNADGGPRATFNDEDIPVEINGDRIEFSYNEALRGETGARIGQVTVTFTGTLTDNTLQGTLSRTDGIISRKQIGMGGDMVTYTEGAAPGFNQVLLDQSDMLPITFNNLANTWGGTRVRQVVPVDISGVWMPRPEMANDWLLYFEETLTEEAVRRRNQWVPYDDPALRCASSGVVRISGWPLPMDIVQSERLIAFMYEGEGAVRRIHMNADMPEDGIPSGIGYSTGRWEGDTLVITTGLLTANLIGARGVEHRGEQTRMTERYSISNDGRFLRSEMILDDPLTYTRPLRRINVWERDMDAEFLPYECDGYTFFKGLHEDGKVGEYFEKAPVY